jgi:hypothetical protein
MARISDHQKNIINPLPGSFTSTEVAITSEIGGRNGSYDYETPRSQWIITGIHLYFLKYGSFPKIGLVLEATGPLAGATNGIPNNMITRPDALAYAALYPQNAEVLRSLTAPATDVPEDSPVNPSDTALGGPLILSPITAEASRTQLGGIITAMIARGGSFGGRNLLTVTTEEFQDPDNQTNASSTPDSSDWAQLTSPPDVISSQRKKDILKSFGETPAPASAAEEDIEAEGSTPKNIKTGTNPFVNAPANNPNPEPYYCRDDNMYYFVQRTDSLDSSEWDLGTIGNNAPLIDKIATFKGIALGAILRSAGKFTPENRQNEDILGRTTVETFYGDPDRPILKESEDSPSDSNVKRVIPPPPRRWIVSGKISKALIDGLPSDGTEADADSTLSNLATSLYILENMSADRQVAFTISGLKSNIAATVRVLGKYHEQATANGADPSTMSGLDLKKELDSLSTFYSVLEKFFKLNKLQPAASDKIEFKFSASFELQYIVVEGKIYLNGITKIAEEGTPSKGVFYDISPTTFGYIFFSPDISTVLTKDNHEESLGWMEFIQTYTWPSPVIYPKDVQNKRKEAAKKRNTRPSNEVHITAARSREKVRSRLFGDKDMYSSVRSVLASSAGSCSTDQAAILRNGMRLYTMMSRKAKTKDLVALAITILRDQIISDKTAKYVIGQAQFYAEHPDEVARLIEREINQELFCIFDIIGDVIKEQILDPAGVPPGASKMLTAAVKPPRGIKFSKSPTRDFFKAWRKKFKQLLLNYIEQLILGIFKDLVSAALGCGPEESADKPTPDFKRESEIASYGELQINDLIDKKGGIDLLAIAELADIKNIYFRPTEDDPKNKQISPPLLEQLRQFNQDTSDVLLKGEVLGILASNASESTVGVVDEMVNRGQANLDGLTREELSNPLVLAERQHSLQYGDIIYATFGLTPQKIEQYYRILGEHLGDIVGSLPGLDPNRAYCDIRDPLVPTPVAMGLTQVQLEAQIDKQIDSKIKKVQGLCDLMKANFSFQAEIEEFTATLGPPQFYTDLLAKISSYSNAAANAIKEALLQQAKAPSQALAGTPIEETQMYQAANQFYGDSKLALELSIASHLRSTEASAGHIKWSVSGGNTGETSFTFLGENRVGIYYKPPGENMKLISSFELSETNKPGDNISPHDMHNTYGRPNLWLKRMGYPPVGQGDSIERIGRMLKGATSIASAHLDPSDPNPYKFGLLAENTYETIKDQLKNFYLTDRGQRKLRKITATMAEPNFTTVDDPLCLNPNEEVIAVAALGGIQVRIVNFLMNAGPLSRVYMSWKTPDTVKMVSSYLAAEIEKDMREKNILDLYYNSIQYIEDFMPNDRQDKIVRQEDPDGPAPEITFDIRSKETVRAKLEYIVEQCFLQMLKRLEFNRASTTVNKNIFEDNMTGDWFTALAEYVQSGTSERLRSLGDDIYNQYDLSEASLSNATLIDGQSSLGPISPAIWGSAVFQNYVPVPLTIALNIIHYDKGVNFVKKFPSLNFYAGQRVALADDALLSAINDQNITIFSHPYDGYPVVIGGNTYYSKEEVEKRIEFLEEQRQRIFSLERMFGPLATLQTSYAPNSYLQRAANEFGDPITDDDGNPIKLEQNVTQFKVSFNHIYSNPRTFREFRVLYPTVAGQKKLIIAALKYDFMSRHENLAIAMGAPDSQSGSMQFNPWAWYERARLIGWAPSDDADATLIAAYKDANDHPNASEQARAITVFLRTHQLKQNMWSPGVYDNNHITTILNSGLGSISEDARNDIFSWSGAGSALLTLTAIGPWLIGAWMGSVYDGIANFFDGGDVFRDPDESDSLRSLRDTPAATRYGTVNLSTPEDMYDCAKALPAHENTLEKVAINHLYYELATKSRDIKPLVDPQSQFNEIEELKEYIAADPTPQSKFPAYLNIDGEPAVFFSTDELEEKIREIRASLLFTSIAVLNEHRSTYDRLWREADSLERSAEAAAEQDLDGMSIASWMVRTYSTAMISGSSASQSFQNIVDNISREFKNFLRLGGLDLQEGIDLEDGIEDFLADLVEILASFSAYGIADAGRDEDAPTRNLIFNWKNRLIGTRVDQRTMAVGLSGLQDIAGGDYGQPGVMDSVDDIQDLYDSIRNSGIPINGQFTYEFRKERILSDLDTLENELSRHQIE